MDSPLLLIVAHALDVALLLHLLNNLIHVALNVCPHTPDLLQRLNNLRSLNRAYLMVAMGLFIKELKMLISNVRDILYHLTVKMSDILSLSFITIFHILNGFVFLIVFLL